MKVLFNGEYFEQRVDLAQHPEWQYADGCLADQLFGQGWAHQVALGYVYPQEAVRKSLDSIWRYCWAPDIKRQNEVHPPKRWFAYPGEGGLFTCTWPQSKQLGEKSTRYRDEVWTGIKYQVANHMAYEGMLTESLAIGRAIHDRYHPSKHNPYPERIQVTGTDVAFTQSVQSTQIVLEFAQDVRIEASEQLGIEVSY